MTTPELLPVIQRKNPEREFEILKQIGSGTYGEVFKVHEYIHVHVHIRDPIMTLGFSYVIYVGVLGRMF